MEIKLLIGLGNPGRDLENTYHNVGQLFIDEVAGLPADSASVATSAKGAAGKAKAGKATFKKEKYFEYVKSQGLVLVKNLTFMNQSGMALAAAKKYFNAEPSKILVIHDDSDIPLGNFKLSFGRGSAGHQGIESIVKYLRTNKFYRLRIGIRPPGEKKRRKADELVLKKIGAREKKILHNLFGTIRTSRLKINSKAHPAAGLWHNS